ncbi:MAG TPA: hypothetical protein PLW93_00695 [Candidatus Absconditabacterales bacterium]|nr:hypothetical protein [Candidatus Absconditabacterales bacterium]
MYNIIKRLLLVVLGIMVWYSLTTHGQEPLKLAQVDLPGFGEYQDNLATYGLNKCREIVGDIDGKYSCENMILTFNAENGGRNKDKYSPKNKNGTRDYGLCQLNSAYHSKFIHSDDFTDPYKQMDYCIGVWNNAKDRGVMPRYAYNKRHKRDKGIRFIDPPLSDNITNPNGLKKGEPIKKPKKVCTQIYTIKEDGSYIQADTMFGKFINWIRDLGQGTKIFSCNDI